MISSDDFPWSNIDKPANGYKFIRVDPDHQHAFFWGKDADGNSLLLFEMTEEIADSFGNKFVDLKGIRIDITYHESTSEYFFTLCLQNKEDVDIFYRLCLDLVDRTRDILARKVALEVMNTRLKRWKSFLSGKRKHLLSPQEVRGLFAEIEFINECITRSADQLTVLEGWLGPLDTPHDFVLGDYAVEVKSVTGSHRDRVKISSENQLVTHLDRLFLHVTFLSEFQDCTKGKSLNQQVAEIRDAISDPSNKDLFDSRLYETGYLELRDYDFPCFAVTDHTSFLVQEEFPRITPGDLAEGVANVNYDLFLKSLKDYKCKFPLDEGA